MNETQTARKEATRGDSSRLSTWKLKPLEKDKSSREWMLTIEADGKSFEGCLFVDESGTSIGGPSGTETILVREVGQVISRFGQDNGTASPVPGAQETQTPSGENKNER